MRHLKHCKLKSTTTCKIYHTSLINGFCLSLRFKALGLFALEYGGGGRFIWYICLKQLWAEDIRSQFRVLIMIFSSAIYKLLQR